MSQLLAAPKPKKLATIVAHGMKALACRVRLKDTKHLCYFSMNTHMKSQVRSLRNDAWLSSFQMLVPCGNIYPKRRRCVRSCDAISVLLGWGGGRRSKRTISVLSDAAVRCEFACPIRHLGVILINLRTPGVEPGSQAWEACMMPLHYVRCDAVDGVFLSFVLFWGGKRIHAAMRNR
jgi:hypothetical protein